MLPWIGGSLFGKHDVWPKVELANRQLHYATHTDLRNKYMQKQRVKQDWRKGSTIPPSVMCWKGARDAQAAGGSQRLAARMKAQEDWKSEQEQSRTMELHWKGQQEQRAFATEAWKHAQDQHMKAHEDWKLHQVGKEPHYEFPSMERYDPHFCCSLCFIASL